MNYKNAYEEMKRLYELLQQENKQLKDRDLIIAAELTKLQDENKKLKNNWNKLKEWVEEGKKISSVHDNRIGYNFTTFILDKMQEIEGGINE